MSCRPPDFVWAPTPGLTASKHHSIDGVLLHSSKALPGAAETLRFLQEHKIPFILLTNGGGKSEAERVAELSVKLG